jgi:hypothetical protein
MVNLNDFGTHGEERVSISFLRSILDIPNNNEVTQSDVDLFHVVLFEYDCRNGFKSGDDYMAYCNHYKINIFGKECTSADFDDVANELFKLMDMDSLFIWATLAHPYGIRFAFGLLEEQNIDGNKILTMKKEFIRSPQLILGIAAEIYKDSTIIRQVALEVIFKNKWEAFFSQSIFERNNALRHAYSSIREGFKKFAMFYSDAANTKEVLKMKDAFIADMLDGVRNHENGHHVANRDMKPEHYDFHWVFPNTDSIGYAIQEALADWARQSGSKKGSFARFLETARTDARRATRNIYAYLSDCWFLDQEDNEYLGILSDVLVGTALSFILADGTVDFERLDAEKDGIYAFFQQRYKELVNKLLAVIKNAEYDFGVKRIDYPALQEKIYQIHKGTRNEKPLEELRHSNFYWDDVVGFLEKYSVDGWKLYQKILAEETVSVEQALLNMVTKGNGEKYNHSLRKYIVERAKETGIIQKPPVLDIPLMINKILEIPAASLVMPKGGKNSHFLT